MEVGAVLHVNRDIMFDINRWLKVCDYQGS